MKSIIVTFSIFFLFSLTAFSQNKKALKAHQIGVKSSAEYKLPLISQDSFYCSGKLRAVYKVTDRNKAKDTVIQLFNSASSGTPLIIVNLLSDTVAGSYYNYSFPTLGINCDVKKNRLVGIDISSTIVFPLKNAIFSLANCPSLGVW